MSAIAVTVAVDELTPIAEYMATEMNVNPRSTVGRRIARLNAAGADKCVDDQTLRSWFAQLRCLPTGISNSADAMKLWYEMVTYAAPWDHKPKIKRRQDLWSTVLSPRIRTEWHVYDDMAYFFDVWSNIHYGYVGLAIGFSKSVLLDGAGLAQLKQDLSKMELPQDTGESWLPRRWDHAFDRATVSLGFELYRKHPSRITSSILVRALLGLGAIRKERVTPKMLAR